MTFGAKLSLQGRFCASAQTGFCSTSSSPLPSHLPSSTVHLPPSSFHLPPSAFHLSPFTSTFHFRSPSPSPASRPNSHFTFPASVSYLLSPVTNLSPFIFYLLLSSPFSPFPLFPFFPSPFSSSLFLLFLSLFHCSTRQFPHFITVLSDPRPACPFPGAEGLSKARRPSAPRQQLNGLRGQTSAEGLEQKNRPSALGTP